MMVPAKNNDSRAKRYPCSWTEADGLGNSWRVELAGPTDAESDM
jgi:hypothetical protein